MSKTESAQIINALPKIPNLHSSDMMTRSMYSKVIDEFKAYDKEQKDHIASLRKRIENLERIIVYAIGQDSDAKKEQKFLCESNREEICRLNTMMRDLKADNQRLLCRLLQGEVCEKDAV